MNPHRLKAYILLFSVSVIWGIAGPVIKYTLGGVSPVLFLFYRFLISTLIAIPITLATGVHFPKDKKVVALMLLYSFLSSTVALGLLFLGYEKTTAMLATLISEIGPILVAVAGVFFLKEHVTKREAVGIGIAFAGTSITVLEPILRNGDGIISIIGNLLIVISLFVGVGNAILAKVLMRKDVNPLFVTNLSFVVGLVTIIPFTLIAQTPAEVVTSITSLPLPYHLGVLYMAILSGTIAYFLWIKAQKTIEVGEAGLFGYLYPVFATPLAVIWLKEKITIPFIIGGLVITLGVIIAEYKKKRTEA